MLVKLFEEQVQQNPENIAVQVNNEQITYSQLNCSVNQIAHTILQGNHQSVALLFDHSIDMIKGLLGALKTGLIYVPLDPSYPEKRLLYMVEHSEATMIVTNQKNFATAQRIASYNPDAIKILNIDLLEATVSMENPEKEIGDDQIAYILYTSGSTGNPKGVMQSHCNIWHFIQSYTRALAITSKDRLTLFSSFSHDAAVIDIYSGLLNGATLYPVNIKNQVNMQTIAEWLINEKITIYHSVPTVYRYFIKTLTGEERFPDLRYIVLGGENVIEHDVIKFREFFQDTVLVNLYGQSESSYNSSQQIGVDSPFRKVTLGEVVDGTNLLVVTDEGVEALPLEVGEIIVACEHIAQGYWKDAEKTAEVFLNHPTLGRLYRTGDLGKVLVNGQIEYVGRKDFQVKVRGYRIELGEIESQLLTHPQVCEGVVIAKEDSDGSTQLVAFMVTEGKVTESELRDYLMDRLPDYMVPTYYERLDKLPVTPNHKLDRKALMNIELHVNAGVEYLPPTNETEEALVQIWANILGTKQIGIRDNFFKIGGNSLLATQLLLHIFKALKVQIPLRTIFISPTIEELAKYIQNATKGIYSPISVIEKQEYYPVSSAQMRLFILHQFESNSVNYNMPRVMYIEGKIDQHSFTKAFDDLIQRHETLRTSFHSIQGEILQKVHENVDFTITFTQAKEAETKDLATQFVRPFDLATAPLLRVELIQTADRYVLMYDMHHIIADGVSMNILVNDFIRLYQGQKLPELKVQYKDFAAWQNDVLKSDQMKQHEAYWLETFSGELPVLNIQPHRPAVMTWEGDRVYFKLNETCRAELNQLMSNNGVTMYMLLLAVYNVLLSKYSGQEDLIIGSPIAGRSHADLENIIGNFVNTLAMRNYPAYAKSFGQFLQDVKETALMAFEHQDYQFEMLVEKLAATRDLSRNPLFDVMFVLQNTSNSALMVFDDLHITPYEFENKTTKFDLLLSAREVGNDIYFELEYSTSLLSRQFAEQLAKHFIRIIEVITDHPEIQLAQIDLLCEDEKRQLLLELNNTKADLPLERTIHQLFEEQVVRTPEKIALVFDGESLTYRELNAQANRLAVRLRTIGVSADQIVGMMLGRSFELVISIIAILKAGGAYLPIDPDYPESRIEYMLTDSKTRFVITQRGLREKIDLSSLPGLNEVIYLDEIVLTDSMDSANLQHINTAQDLVYVIYTSGSTGKPKGVLLEHQNVTNLIRFEYDKTNIDFAEGRVLQFATISFDVSFQEIFSTLLAGGELYLIHREVRENVIRLMEFIEDHQINIVFMPVALIKFIFGDEQYYQKFPKTIRHIITAGEQLIVTERFRTYLQENHVYYHNHYGPSETHVVTTLTVNPDGDIPTLPPIGRPISNTQIYIVNHHQQLQPLGVPGELWIAGRNVGRGYLNREELTKDKFVTNPFGADSVERVYRTGDVARWLPDGTIEFLGREDEQVKIRGFRIELDEITSCLLKHEKIENAVVIDREDQDGFKYLCAYLVSDEEISVSVLKAELAKVLPDYMIPTYMIRIAAIPLTANQKVDRRALPEPIEGAQCEVEYVKPRTELEQAIAAIWSELLGVRRIGLHDNFFSLGGHSLKVIAFISKIEEQYQTQLSMKEFFKNPTVRGVVDDLIAHRNENVTYHALDEPYIVFNPAKEKKLFCFPPGRAFGLAYSGLACYLDSYSLYGFNFIENADRIQEYVKIITQAQIDEPVILVGYSAGGYLAFEVAKELLKNGRAVSDLILLDVQKGLRIYPTLEEKRNAALEMIHLLEASEEYKGLVELPEVKEKIMHKFITYMEFVNEVANTGTIDANIHFIKAKAFPGKESADLGDLWAPSTTKQFVTYAGFGYHGEMLDPSYAAKNGKIIKDILTGTR